MHGLLVRLGLFLLIPAEPVKGKCPGPESKDCPTACHSGGKKEGKWGKKKAVKALDPSQSLARGKTL